MVFPSFCYFLFLLLEFIFNSLFSKTYEGHVHDKKTMDKQPVNPTGITLWQITGFLGHNPKEATLKMPTKKPKGKHLTHTQKQENRKISGFRILVEHAIAGVKKCRIVKNRFRCRKIHYYYRNVNISAIKYLS